MRFTADEIVVVAKVRKYNRFNLNK